MLDGFWDFSCKRMEPGIGKYGDDSYKKFLELLKVPSVLLWFPMV